MSKTKVYSPFFIVEATVTGMTHLDMLEQRPWSQLKGDFPGQLHIQQNEAVPHFSMAMRDYFSKNLLEAWIGGAGRIPWPPKFPDLTPRDFTL
jgi:hypothetical protein